MNRIISASAIFMVHSSTLLAAEGKPASLATPMAGNPIDVTSLFQVLMALFVVVAAIFVVAWLFKRYSMDYGQGNQGIKVVSAISLGGKEKAVVLQVGEEQIMLGVSPGYVKKIHSLTTPIKSRTNESSGSFLAKLNQEIHKVVNK